MAKNGVLLYFKKTTSGHNTGITFTGQAHRILEAPNANSCCGEAGLTNSSCTYPGIAIFMARDNYGVLDIRGNGESRITGLVYALNGTLIGRGGGEDPDEWVVDGQVIAGRVARAGNGSLVVRYKADNTFVIPQLMSLEH